MQERLESSVVGRALLSLVVAAVLVATLIHVMPDSVLKSRIYGPAHSFITFLGMGQEWGMFSPDPPKAVTYTEAHITYSDGTTSAWSSPDRRGPMAYSDYHWHVFATLVGLDAYSRLWPGFAVYLADSEAAGREPVEVSLKQRWAFISPPGVSPPQGPWRERVYHVESIGVGK